MEICEQHLELNGLLSMELSVYHDTTTLDYVCK